MSEFTVVSAALFGLIVGSFLNVVIYRMPRGESIAYPASHCPVCSHTLSWTENIPLVSWLVQGGRCRHCRASISSRYPLVEATTAALFALTALVYGTTIEALAVALLAATLVAVVFIDLDHLLILDVVLAPAALIGIFDALVYGRIGDALLGALVGAAIFGLLFLLTRGAGMGLGDAKLALVLGLFLGLHLTIAAIAFSFIFGSLLMLPVLAAGSRGRRDAVPFGPFLVLGALVALYVPNALAWVPGLARLPFGT
jgi:leader peptidase (prepilin peptidase) / N-methyltransferase